MGWTSALLAARSRAYVTSVEEERDVGRALRRRWPTCLSGELGTAAKLSEKGGATRDWFGPGASELLCVPEASKSVRETGF